MEGNGYYIMRTPRKTMDPGHGKIIQDAKTPIFPSGNASWYEMTSVQQQETILALTSTRKREAMEELRKIPNLSARVWVAVADSYECS